MSNIAAALGLDPTSNYSALGLPLYYLLCIVPHAYALTIASGGKPVTRWDNRNPRTDELRASLKQRLPAALYARYQRGEAAHYNSLESFPLVAAAVVLGNVAGLPKGELNDFVVLTGLLRVVYILAYVNTAQQKFTAVRSLVWFAQLGVNAAFLWKAGKALA